MRSEILNNPLPYLAVFFCEAIWAINTVVVKITLHDVPVMSLLFIRFFVSSLILLPFLIKYHKTHKFFVRNHVKAAIFTGIFMIVLNNGFGYTGMYHTTAIDTAILGLFTPIVSVLLGWWFLKERIYRINLVGIMFGFTGALVILGFPFLSNSLLTAKGILGNSLIIISGLFVSIGFLLSKETVKIYPPIILTIYSFIIGAIFFLPLAMLDLQKNPQWLLHVNTQSIAGLVFITIFSTTLSYLLIVWVLGKIPMGQANLFQYIQPAITTALAIPLLGEKISSMFLIGAALIIAGAYWGTLGKPQHSPLHHKPQHI